MIAGSVASTPARCQKALRAVLPIPDPLIKLVGRTTGRARGTIMSYGVSRKFG
jgi:hypothetical protein